MGLPTEEWSVVMERQKFITQLEHMQNTNATLLALLKANRETTIHDEAVWAVRSTCEDFISMTGWAIASLRRESND
jgi:hypothetical protein